MQRSDEDRSIFEVSYRGRHTCNQASPSPVASPSPKNDCSKQSKYHCKQQQQQQHEDKPEPTNETSVNFGSDCFQARNEDLGSKDDIFPSFSFPCTSSGIENEENTIFTDSMVENFPGSCSPTFKSPATSESNYFSVSPCRINSFGMCYQNVNTRGCGLTTEKISAPTSLTNSPTRDLDISIDNLDFDTTFPFDNLEFFAK